MSTQIQVFIADDHPIFRSGLKQVIQRDPQLDVVGEAEDGVAALERLPQSGAQIAVLDVDMPKKDGFDVVRAIVAQGLNVEFVILTLHKDEHFLTEALDLGVRGYVLKESAPAEIVRCIHAVAAGHDYVSPELSGFLIKRHRRAAELAATQPGVSRLSPTERKVLWLIGQYQSTKEIASQLHIGVRTVEHHRANIAEKLQLTGPNALLRFAIEHQSELA
jgi:DNA-binding NarL/FixJ family response regulator